MESDGEVLNSDSDGEQTQTLPNNHVQPEQAEKAPIAQEIEQKNIPK